MFSAQIGGFRAGFPLFEDANDLLFGKARFLQGERLPASRFGSRFSTYDRGTFPGQRQVPERVPYLDQLRRASEPHDAYVHASVHPANERVLEEGGEPKSRPRVALRLLQFLPQALVYQDDAGDRGWVNEAPLDDS